MEFKGTKGNENEKFSYAFNILYPNWDCVDVIGHYEQAKVKGFQIGYAKALEDSRAIEILEAMQEFCDRVDRGEVRSTKTYNKFKEIIHLVNS